jgi:hypothetical protein
MKRQKNPAPAVLYDLQKAPWDALNAADDPAYAAACREMADL